MFEKCNQCQSEININRQSADIRMIKKSLEMNSKGHALPEDYPIIGMQRRLHKTNPNMLVMVLL